jgi:hypothetical protein
MLQMNLPLGPAEIENRLQTLTQKRLLPWYGTSLKPLAGSPGRYRLTKTMYRRIPLRLEITLTPTTPSQTDLQADFSTPPMVYIGLTTMAGLSLLALFLALADLPGLAFFIMLAVVASGLLNYAVYRYDQRTLLTQVKSVLE